MKILHTADWHLGVSLGAEKRFDEYDSLLDHFRSIIKEENIDVVIIAGDVFDSHIPPNRAAEQYYRFLVQAGKAGVKEIIVIGGNHDSAAYLEAPKEILKYLSVHVFASASQNCRDMIVELYRPFSDFTLSLSSISYTEAVEILKQASQNFTFTPEVVYIYMKISFSYLSDH